MEQIKIKRICAKSLFFEKMIKQNQKNIIKKGRLEEWAGNSYRNLSEKKKTKKGNSEDIDIQESVIW